MLEKPLAIRDSDEDLLPEHCHYRDEGCEISVSCLNCPYPDCIHEAPGGRQKWLKAQRDREVCRLYATEGKNAKELALKFGVSQRTIQRIVQRTKK